MGQYFEPNRLTAYDKNVVLAEVRRVLDGYFPTRCPSHAEFNKYARVHSATVVKVFGSWAEAMAAADRAYTRSKISREELRRDLVRVFDIAGQKYFTQEYYEKNGGLRSPNTLKSSWGMRAGQICFAMK